MEQAKHTASFTPGPWRVGREIGESQLMPRIEILRDVSFVEGAEPATYYMAEVCYPTTTGNTVGAQERRANARLIAAAPTMYQTLTDMDGWLNACGYSEHHPWRISLRAAISMATGGSAL